MIPIAVITGDVHFTINTLEEATLVVKKAQDLASELQVPLILNGDTLDSKAILRAECVNRLIELLTRPNTPKTYINVGNHEKINEKGKEHALHFLKPYATVIDIPTYIKGIGAYIVPYISDKEELRAELAKIPNDSLVIAHQGIIGADLGHYIKDDTSIEQRDFSRFRVIASHYHKKQDLILNSKSMFSYIGNPYTLNFGEAGQGDKGISVLQHNWSLAFYPLNLRKHIILNRTIETIYEPIKTNPNDLVMIKVTGIKSQLSLLDKKKIGKQVLGHSDFRLEFITTDDIATVMSNKEHTAESMMDVLIDSIVETKDNKQYLKTLWKQVYDENN